MNDEFRCRCCTTPIPYAEENTPHGKKQVCFDCYDDDQYLQEISPVYFHQAMLEESSKK